MTVIQFTTITDGRGTLINVTLVSFEQQFGAPSTVTFCGTLGNQFILNAFTTVDSNFAPGPSCATALPITVSG